jgi:hypothetical protein
MTIRPRARRVFGELLVIVCTASCLALPASSTAAGSPRSHRASMRLHHTGRSHHAGRLRRARGSHTTWRRTSHRTPPAYSTSGISRPVRAASRARTRADHRLVSKAKALQSCQRRRPRRCKAAARAVQQAGSRLARTERRLSKLASGTSHPSRFSASAQAPQLTVSGQTLSWSRIGRVNSYVFVRKVPGEADQYSVVSGTSTTPPPVPGASVRYGLRTNINGSAWAGEQSISYPSSSTSLDNQAAPLITVSGQTLSWKAVGSVNTYVFVRKVPGQADQYSAVSGTSITPPAVPGATVRYGLRTAVDGSAWAQEVSIAYPPSESGTSRGGTPESPGPPAESPSPEGSSGGGGGAFEMGVVAGSALSYELPFLQQLGAHTARMEVSIDTPASQLESTIDAYARAGVRPMLLAGFDGRLPSTAEAQGLAGWAAAYGPGGSFWQGKSYPAGTAVTDIELGNETSYTYQFSDNSSATYAGRAQSYALRAKEAQIAIQAANPNVGLLVQADSGGGGNQWVDNMFAAVPDLAQRVAGWTVHPYGSNWQARLDQLVSSTASHGASSSIPIYITEWGLSTDNGHCLDNNYGWNACMTYSQAAGTLETAVNAMRVRYGPRLAAMYLYQAHDQKASGATNGRESYFGALQSNGSTKGAYTTEVQTLLSANP